jgi:hypothetical protein
MPYDVSTITVHPTAHPKQIPAIEQWLKANPRRGEFLACLVAEIGELNKVMLLHHYDSEADLAADRAGVAASANPYGIGEMIAAMTSDTFVQFPFLPAIKPGQYGPVFEVRTYSLRATGLQPTIAAWETAVPARAKMTPLLAAMYSTTGAVVRFMHIWPYPSLEVRAQTRKTAVETGVWPPPGGPGQLLTMVNAIFLPAAFSPIR